MRYDACIIGAGAEGLAAAAVLAAKRRRVKLLERLPTVGGRCVTAEFAPGFFASPYVDELPAIPPAIFRELDLARHGAIAMPAATAPLADLRAAVIDRVLRDADQPRRGWFAGGRPPWPGEELATRAGRECGGDPAQRSLAKFAGPPGGVVRGGLGALAAALRAAAEVAGADIACNAEVSDIRRRHGRVVAVGLADGSEIATNAVISTLDLKRTFLCLFAWNELPKAVVERVAAFRPAPGTARLLLALAAPPPGDWRQPMALAADDGLRAWSAGLIPERPPAVLRLISAVDPFLAPDGAAVLTFTMSAIPHTPFDGPWDEAKRQALQSRALARADDVFPGLGAQVRASQLILPPDIESRLGLSEGDLSGGALTASQMLSFRPFADAVGSRTPIKGLYLAGPSSALGPLATCASGVAAARAVLADGGGAP